MRGHMRITFKRHSSCFLFSASLILACSYYIGQVTSLPADTSSNQWPVFPRRNLASLAREGYLKGVAAGNKRSISTLAKNGQLPTFRSPYGEAVKDDPDDDTSHEKRDLSAISELPSYPIYKRNIQALARDGHRFGRGSQQNEKRNIQALARNGYIHKRDEDEDDQYYYPFYPYPPLTEKTDPVDLNEWYEFQELIYPDMFPSLSQVSKRSNEGSLSHTINPKFDYDSGLNLKRGSVGLPTHGLYRPVYIDLNSNVRNRRSIYSIPDVINHNDIDAPDDYDSENDDKRSVDIDEVVRENFEKRHIGSLARLGLLPSFRFSGNRYSRSGRARLLLPSQELYRKHSPDENFGVREYLTNTEADISVDSDDSDVSPPTVSAHTHPTGRYLHRPLNNNLQNTPIQPIQFKFGDTYDKNRWQGKYKANPKFYYFRSLKIPYHESGKRYMLPVDNIMLRKSYRNASLPGRRKNL